MDEEPLFPMKSLFILIMIVAWLAVIALAVYLFFSINIELHEKEMERVVVEVADALTKQKLTNELAIFSRDELEKYHKSKAEPYYRPCNYGYTLRIKTEKNKWEFGYKPEHADLFAIKQFGVNFPVEEKKLAAKYPVAVNDNGRIIPAQLELTLYRSAITEVSCLVHSAHVLSEIQQMEFECPWYGDMYKCGFPVTKRGDYICLFYIDEEVIDNKGNKLYLKIYTDECRYLPGIEVVEMYHVFPIEKNIVLKAIPIKKSSVPLIVPDGECEFAKGYDICKKSPYPMITECSELESHKAEKGEPQAVVLCFDKGDDS